MKKSVQLCLFWVIAFLVVGCGQVVSSRRNAFLGDSVTEGWTLPVVNLGVHGQTTEQMLARFPQQIPGHGYKTVFILGGTNDVLLQINPQVTAANLSRMIDVAESSKVEPVLAQIPPIYYRDGKFLPAVKSLNERIVQLAEKRHVKLVKYYDALIDHPGFESDGVHMKRSGYLMMDLALIRAENPF